MLLALLPATNLWSMETSYTFEVEARGFPSIENNADPTQPDQFESNSAISFEPEFNLDVNGGNTAINFTPFGRWDSRDRERRHVDIRELNVLHAAGQWEFLVGVSKVFWGVVESNHLIDIINQTDTLEGFDGEDKLGQPMIRLSRSFDQSTLTIFALPGFRERGFLSSDNPLALPFDVDRDNPIYESDDAEDHVDYALRYSGYLDIIDYGFSWFDGTSREPGFLPRENGLLAPFYPQVEQLGVDLQVTSEEWLWKIELIRRKFDQNPTSRDYTAIVGGLEYSIYGLSEGLYDLGLLAELNYDSRNDPATTAFQNDLFLATRFGFNDSESSEILAGGFFDLDDDSTSFRVEANRRVLGNARISVEAQIFSKIDPGNISFGFRNSDFIRLSLEYFF